MRKLADPFTVAPPSGTHARTRLRVTPGEESLLEELGAFLGSLFRAEVALWSKDPRQSIGARKQALTAATSSRWANSLTRATKHQVRLSLDALFAHRDQLRKSVETLEARLAAPVGQEKDRARGLVAGYASQAEWFHKRRRLDVLRSRLAGVEAQCKQRSPRIVLGGKALLRKKSNLAAAGLTAQDWREQWDASRMFLTAVGESGVVNGNLTIRVSADGTVTIRLPGELAARHGASHLTLEAKVSFDTHRGSEWLARVEAHESLTYALVKDPVRGRWYVDVSWSLPEQVVPTAEQLGSQARIGVDVNADHLAAHLLDPSGNPVGQPITIPLQLTGLPASTRDARLREAVSQLLGYAKTHGVHVIAIENLNFQDARDTGRESMGRGTRGKKFRRTVAGIPTAQFRDRLAAMAATAGVWIVAVDPAYTSKWGQKFWGSHTQATTQSSTRTLRTRHHAAAVAIGRRSSSYPVRRREPGPDARQRTRGGLPEPGDSSSKTRTHTPPAKSDLVRSRGNRGKDPAPFGVRSGPGSLPIAQ